MHSSPLKTEKPWDLPRLVCQKIGHATPKHPVDTPGWWSAHDHGFRRWTPRVRNGGLGRRARGEDQGAWETKWRLLRTLPRGQRDEGRAWKTPEHEQLRPAAGVQQQQQQQHHAKDLLKVLHGRFQSFMCLLCVCYSGQGMHLDVLPRFETPSASLP